MQTIRTLPDLRAARGALPGRVALVPTMGALHAGHLALVAAAAARADHVAVSIFVNPTQFGANEDFARYPRQEAADAALLAAAGVALLWAPDAATMYPPGHATRVVAGALGEGLEGAHRPGHFDGVATVVVKLLNQVRPDIALFGEKDWQQLQVVRRVVADLDLPVAIEGMATARDADGVALSSRNAFLSPAERIAARALPRALGEVAAALAAREAVAPALAAGRATLAAAGLATDYLVAVDAALQPVAEPAAAERVLVAARAGATRLIDNLAVPRPC